MLCYAVRLIFAVLSRLSAFDLSYYPAFEQGHATRCSYLDSLLFRYYENDLITSTATYSSSSVIGLQCFILHHVNKNMCC